MIRPRWKKMLYELYGQVGRTVLVVASITVGTFATGVIVASSAMIEEDMNGSYAAVNPANVRVYTEDFGDDLVDSVARIDGVAAAQGRRLVSVRVMVGPEEWKSLDITAIDDFTQREINGLDLVEGHWPPDDRELVVDIGNFDDLGIEVGETVIVRMPDGRDREVVVGAIVQDQMPSFGTSGNLDVLRGYMSYDSLPFLSQPQRYNQMFVRVAGDGDDLDYIETVSWRITDQLEGSGRDVFGSQLYRSTEHPNSSMMVAIRGVLFTMGVVTVVLSGFLITNTLSALLKQHVRHIGVMKAVGARDPQITAMYFMLLLAFGVISLVIAVPLSNRAAYALVSYLGSELVFDVGEYRTIPLAIAMQVAVSILMPIVAGAYPVWRGARITIREAISDYGLNEGAGEHSVVDRLVESVRGLSRPMLISLRNTFRRKGRLALTLATLSLGGALFIAVFNTQVALDDYIRQISRYFLADVNVTFQQPYLTEEVERVALQVPGVVAIEGWSQAATEIVRDDGSLGQTVYIQAPPAESTLVEPIMVEGRWIVPGDQQAIVVNEAFISEVPGTEVGGTITLRVNGEDVEWVVVGIYQFVGDADLIAYADYTYLSGLLGEPGRAWLFRVVGEDHDLASQIRLAAAVDRAYDAQGYQIGDVSAGGNLVAKATETLDVLTVFLLIMALLVGLVGNIGLAGTMSLNVMERIREIGVMRAIGAKDGVIMRMIITEGELIGLISWVLAAVLSFPITNLLSNQISWAIFNVPANFAFTFTGFVAWFGLVAVLAAVASIAPARNAARLTIREVLAYE